MGDARLKPVPLGRQGILLFRLVGDGLESAVASLALVGDQRAQVALLDRLWRQPDGSQAGTRVGPLTTLPAAAKPRSPGRAQSRPTLSPSGGG